MSMQCASEVLLISPDGFQANPDTLTDNRFQEAGAGDSIRQQALKEFEALAKVLEDAGIGVHRFSSSVDLPDAVFPNNWFSTHQEHYYLYSMFAVSRRRERQAGVISFLDARYSLEKDFSSYESNNLFLEGTGSMVLDRDHRIAYACASKRTSSALFDDWCEQEGYEAMLFSALDEDGFPMYHTNVMLALTPSYAVIADTLIPDTVERSRICESLCKHGRELIHLTEEQVRCFCGNILTVQNQSADTFVVLSDAALHGFTDEQRLWLASDATLLHVPLTTIETYGGGSARCMIAELY